MNLIKEQTTVPVVGAAAQLRQTCGVMLHKGGLLAKLTHNSAVGRYAVMGLGMLLSLGLVSLLAAQVLPPQQDIETIRKSVRKFLYAEIKKIGKPGEVTVSHLDSQLRLSRCDKTPEVFFLNRSRKFGSLSVGVRCKGSNTWTIYVPVRVGVLAKVTVVSRALLRGHVISATDIHQETKDLANLSEGYLLDVRDVIGKSLSQSMVIGAVITPALIKPARAIRRGDKVTILFHRKGVEIRMPGIAMADGAPGERVRVRNILSKKVLQGIVTKHGEIKVQI
ncbi:MAG: flagellar basal body P-ring formation chaperone FlgA [Acidiferrobacterales bacterium]